jgi:WD40 repeat protein
VYCIQFDSENDLLISSSQDATVKLWDMSATTATLNCTLKGHTGPVGSVSFLPSAHLAISGSDDKTIRVWDTARAAEAASKDGGGSSSASCVKVLQTGGEDGVWALQFDAQRLVADSGDKTMGMWDTETMELLTKFSGHTYAPSSLLVSLSRRLRSLLFVLRTHSGGVGAQEICGMSAVRRQPALLGSAGPRPHQYAALYYYFFIVHSLSNYYI